MNNDYRIVTIHNPSSEPFELFYNNSLTKTIPPKGYLKVPWNPLGILAEKHLIDRMCNINKKSTNDKVARGEYQKQILILDENDDTLQNLSESEVLQRKLDLLNKTNSSDMIKTCDMCQVKTFNMSEHKMLNHDEKPPVPPVPQVAPVVETVATPPVPQAPVTPLQKESAKILANAVGKSGTQEFPEQVIEDAPEATEQHRGTPTREQLVAFAKDELLMKVDDPATAKVLAERDIDSLVRELHYPI